MEKAGLERGLAFLDGQNIKVSALVTDQHLQIQAWMRDFMGHIRHFYDNWHVAKGSFSYAFLLFTNLYFEKKLGALGKRKGMEQVLLWLKSIVFMVYWVAMTSGGDPDLAEAKWRSLPRHLINKHTGHGDLYPKCEHDKIRNRREKPWFREGEFTQ